MAEHRSPAAELAVRLRPPNPLRSEADAFGFLIWFVALVALIVLGVLLARTL